MSGHRSKTLTPRKRITKNLLDYEVCKSFTSNKEVTKEERNNEIISLNVINDKKQNMQNQNTQTYKKLLVEHRYVLNNNIVIYVGIDPMQNFEIIINLCNEKFKKNISFNV